MPDGLDQARLERTRALLRGEQLRRLKFADAFRDTLSMMTLLIDMTQSFTSPAEYQHMPPHCGSLPDFRKSDGAKAKKKP
jgi:hypothetical protein